MAFPKKCDHPIPINHIQYCQPLLFWNDISFDVPNVSQSLDANFYISTSMDEPENQMWSYPICLNSLLSENNRHSVSVPIKNNSTTFPLAVSSHKCEGMIFLVVSEDPSAMLLLHNETNMTLYYGQSIPESEGTLFSAIHKNRN